MSFIILCVLLIVSYCAEYKLVDVKEMNYVAHPTDPEALPRGEICLRGPSVFVGYYKMDDKT